jgi:hypothetical protein
MTCSARFASGMRMGVEAQSGYANRLKIMVPRGGPPKFNRIRPLGQSGMKLSFADFQGFS